MNDLFICQRQIASNDRGYEQSTKPAKQREESDWITGDKSSHAYRHEGHTSMRVTKKVCRDIVNTDGVVGIEKRVKIYNHGTEGN